MSANSASADNLGENLGVRSVGILDNELLILGQDVTTEEQFIVDLPGAGIGTMSRFPLGSYIQIDNESMFIRKITGNTLSVNRGQYNTSITTHAARTAINVINDADDELIDLDDDFGFSESRYDFGDGKVYSTTKGTDV